VTRPTTAPTVETRTPATGTAPAGPTVDLHGTRVPAHSVVFLLDGAASMSERGLLAAARGDLAKFVQSMDWPQRLNAIAFYADSTDAAFEDLVRAGSNNKEALAAFVEKLPAKSVSNLIPALKEAFGQLHSQGPGTDKAVVIITDGKFADGPNVAALLKELNLQRDVKVYTVLEGAQVTQAADLLTKIANDNGGKFIAIPH
jgi:Mg-chelatase subunit ChlD